MVSETHTHTRTSLTVFTSQFVMCVRDPVKRAYSNWNMQLQVAGGSGIEDLSFPEAIERELQGLMGEKRVYGTALYHYVQRGLYMDQIERFLKVSILVRETVRETVRDP